MEPDLMTASLMLSVRFGTATALTPIFGSTSLPGFVRVALSLAFGIAVAASLPSAAIQGVGALAIPTLALALLREAVIGAVFSIGFLSAYAATQVAGRVLDIQIGFGVAGILNPATNAFSPLLGSLFGMVGIAIFLSMDGHHQLLRALQFSSEIAPPNATSHGINASAILQQSALMFVYGLMLAAPVMLALLLIDITLAVYARSLPQLNILVLSFAIKVVVGMLLLAVSLKWVQWTFSQLYTSTFTFWSQQPVLP